MMFWKRFPQWLALVLTVVMLAVAGCSSSGPKEASSAKEAGGGEQAGVKDAGPAITWKLAHQWPTTHFYHTGVENFVKNVEKASNGRLIIQVYPAGQLYDMREIPEAVINSTIELGMAAGVGYTSYVPTMGIFDLPMLVPDGATMFKLLNGKLGEEMTKDLAAKGMAQLAWIDYGPMHYMTGTKQITRPEEVAGLKITVPGGMHVDAVAALGGTPVTTPPAEHYLALQRGVTNGILVGATSMESRKLYEVQKYLTLVTQSWPIHLLTANPKKLAALPSDLQKIVRDEAKALEKWVSESQTAEDKKAIEKMKSAGIQVHTVPSSEFANWRAKFAGVWDKYTQSAGPRGKELLELVTKAQ